MKNYRKWGEPPYKIVVVHGGPGIPGSAAPLAVELSQDTGVLELLETADTVAGQVTELAEVLQEHAAVPAVLVGHSWGAVLSCITVARYPDLVKALILVSMPALQIRDRPDYSAVWLDRLPEKERVEMLSLQEFVWDGQEGDKSEAMRKLFRLIAHADSYDCLPREDEVLEYQPGVNMSVGLEFTQMLKTGELLDLGRKIQCPVVAVHGDFDLRPARVVQESLSAVIKDFRFHLLEKCGHYPWMERHARDNFFEILRKEVDYALAGNK